MIAISFAAEVLADSGGNYAANSLRFATVEEAESYAADLAGRWTLVTDWRIAPTSDPVTHLWTAAGAERIAPFVTVIHVGGEAA